MDSAIIPQPLPTQGLQARAILYRNWIQPDGSLKLEYITPGGDDLLEYTADELLAAITERRLILYGVDDGAFYASIESSLRDFAPWNQVFGYITPRTGTRRWLQSQDFPLTSQNGRRYFAGVLLDISDWKAAEDQLRQSHALLTGHIDNTPLAVIEWDSEWKVVRWTGQAEAIFGWREDEVLGKTPLEWRFVHDDDAERIQQVMQRLVSEKLTRNITTNRNYTRTGDIVHCEWHNSVMTDDRGRFQSCLSLAMDVTDRVRAEDERAFIRDLVNNTQKFESLGRMAGGIAHDFNNLLTVIVGNTNLAMMDLPAGHAARDRLMQVEEACQRATRVCRQMLAFAGKTAVSPRPVDVTAIVSNSIDLLKSAIGRKANILWTPPKLPIASIHGETQALQQVLLSLLTNAAEAYEGQGPVQIHVEQVTISETLTTAQPPLTPGAYIALAVEDQGAGMTADVAAQMFEPFFSTKFMGRGLGLSAALGIVRSHRGSIAVRSQPRLGTRMTVYLPALPN
jgi:PAS domain S-box-containing protein